MIPIDIEQEHGITIENCASILFEGNGEDVGDLPVYRNMYNLETYTFWKPSEHEMEVLKNGGLVRLTMVSARPLPCPVSIVATDIEGRDGWWTT